MKMSQGEVTYLDHMGGDLDVCEAAWVSFNKWADRDGNKRENRDPKRKELELIRFLALNNHWTPFSHVVIKLRIKAAIFVRSQLFKSMVGSSVNELSRRYVTSGIEMFDMPVLRKAHENKKQGSGDDHPASDEMNLLIQSSYRQAEACYEELIAKGVCPEQARAVLPQGAMTEYVCTGTLEFWARLCALRIAPDAQRETRMTALSIAAVCRQIAPVAFSRRVGAHRIARAALEYADARYKQLEEHNSASLFMQTVDSEIASMREDVQNVG